MTFSVYNPRTREAVEHAVEVRDVQEFKQYVELWLSQNPGWIIDKLR